MAVSRRSRGLSPGHAEVGPLFSRTGAPQRAKQVFPCEAVTATVVLVGTVRREVAAVEVGKILTGEGRTLHVFADPDAPSPFVLGVSGDRRQRPFTVALTAIELEQLLTLLEKAGRVQP